MHHRSSQSPGVAGALPSQSTAVDGDLQSPTNSSSSATATSAAIAVRRVRLTSSSQLPSTYSQTPGGTIFGTTPGGTRVIYDRDFLLSRRDCPLARTPPSGLPRIPGVTVAACAAGDNEGDSAPVVVNGGSAAAIASSGVADGSAGTEFEMDI